GFGVISHQVPIREAQFIQIEGRLINGIARLGWGRQVVWSFFGAVDGGEPIDLSEGFIGGGFDLKGYYIDFGDFQVRARVSNANLTPGEVLLNVVGGGRR